MENKWQLVKDNPPSIGQVIVLIVEDVELPVLATRVEKTTYKEIQGQYSYDSKSTNLYWLNIPKDPRGIK